MKLLVGGGIVGREALCYQMRGIIKCLESMGCKIKTMTKMGGYFEKYQDTFQGEEDYLVFNVHYTSLPELAKNHKKIISVCVFETKMPHSWVDALNIPEVKQIWTVSEFCKQKIIESGVIKPIEVINLGIDERFKRNGANVSPKDKSFKFLNVSAPHGMGKVDRKGLHILVNAFKEEFGDSSEITLILKINPIYMFHFNPNRSVNDYIKSLLPNGININNIAILQDYLGTEWLNNLYNTCDCGVYPHMGEGFGLPIAEMIKIGKPVITTDYSATNEFSDPRLRIKVQDMVNLDLDCEHPYLHRLFANPDKIHLKKLMRQVYENYKEESELAKAYSKEVDRFTWAAVSQRMFMAFRSLDEINKKNKK